MWMLKKCGKLNISDYYQMDSLYKEFHIAFSMCLQTLHPSLDDGFKDLADYVEKRI